MIKQEFKELFLKHTGFSLNKDLRSIRLSRDDDEVLLDPIGAQLHLIIRRDVHRTGLYSHLSDSIILDNLDLKKLISIPTFKQIQSICSPVINNGIIVRYISVLTFTYDMKEPIY